MIDTTGEVLAESLPISGDELCLVVRWKESLDLKEVSRGPIQLKIHLTDASLYAFRVE